MIQIPIAALKKARTLLGRVRFAQCKLPALNHILARIDSTGITLAVSDLDSWLETRITLSCPPTGPEAFIIPSAALATAVKADKGSEVTFMPKGRKGHQKLNLVTISGGIKIESMHSTADWEDFPDRPVIKGPAAEIPASTFDALKTVAPCASLDEERQILCGVLFSPEGCNGSGANGMLIATDTARLAGAPALVPGRRFILPNTAVNALIHPDFAQNAATVILPEDATKTLVAVQSGPHTLLSRTIEGAYPAYKQEIPREYPASVMIPEDRKPGLIKWLLGLRSSSRSKSSFVSVTMSMNRPGELILTRRGSDGNAATLRFRAEVSGLPPTITFNPAYLAKALEIGGTLRFSRELNRCMTEGPGGRFCIVMPMRVL